MWFLKSGVCVFFLTPSPMSKIPLKHEIQMKFEVDFPGYIIGNVQPVYNDNINRILYKCNIFSIDEETLTSGELKKMLIKHPNYILDKTIWVR